MTSETHQRATQTCKRRGYEKWICTQITGNVLRNLANVMTRFSQRCEMLTKRLFIVIWFSQNVSTKKFIFK